MTCLKRIAGRLALAFVVPATSLWMISAVWFSNLPGNVLPAIATAATGLAILAILAGVKSLWHSIGLIFGLFAIIYCWVLLIPASNNRDWQPPVARLSTADFSEEGDSVTIRNIRNFEFRSPQDFDVRYYDKTFALGQIRGADLIVSYWGSDAMAHTFLSFEFEEGNPLAISIEIRPETGETFHPLAGLFKQYEIIYVVGDERDLIRLRTNHRGEETYLYKTTATPEQARQLLVEMLEQANQLAQTPAYYGTIRNNCTTALVKHVNKILATEIPYSGMLLFNGFSDKLAHTRGNIQNDLPFHDLKAASCINSIAKELDQDPDFSAKIRAHLQTELTARKNHFPAQ